MWFRMLYVVDHMRNNFEYRSRFEKILLEQHFDECEQRVPLPVFIFFTQFEHAFEVLPHRFQNIRFEFLLYDSKCIAKYEKCTHVWESFSQIRAQRRK